jgi:hypothetical protein
MSRGYGSSVIPVALFLLLVLIVLPVGASNETTTPSATITADNATPPITETILPQTTIVTPEVTGTAAETPPVTVQTATTSPQTTGETAQLTAIPTETTVAASRPATAVATASPALSMTETGTTGNVMVYSSPTGASILIDGTYTGTTPGTVNGIPAGNHILRLTLSGYYDYEGSIYIVPGQTTQGYGTLQPVLQTTSAGPTPVQTVIVPVIVPGTPAGSEETGVLENSSVMVAIIGAISVLIAAGVKVYNHVRPPKKE